MNEKQIIEFCIRNSITVEQYFIVYLTRRRWEGFRQEFVDYTRQFPWTQVDMKTVVAKKMVVASEDTEELSPISLCIPEKDELNGSETFASDQVHGDELWYSYPATFPLFGGGVFIARTGMGKEQLIELYLDKIGRDPEKHQFVLQQLEKYIRLVQTGKINGHKISDWVANEMWDTISAIEGGVSVSPFKTDV